MTGMITEFVVIVSSISPCAVQQPSQHKATSRPSTPLPQYGLLHCDWGAYCNTVLPLHALPCSVVEQSFYLFFNSKYHAHLLWFVYFVYVVRLFGIFELVSRKL